MEYRINTYNENYLMINQFNLFNTLCKLQFKNEKTKEEKKIETKLQEAKNSKKIHNIQAKIKMVEV